MKNMIEILARNHMWKIHCSSWVDLPAGSWGQGGEYGAGSGVALE